MSSQKAYISSAQQHALLSLANNSSAIQFDDLHSQVQAVLSPSQHTNLAINHDSLPAHLAPASQVTALQGSCTAGVPHTLRQHQVR